MTHLYIATRSDNPLVLKVGRSNNPEGRCASLQCSHCFEVKLLAIWPNAGEYETAVHRALDALREPGPGREWFRASPAEIYSAIALSMRGKRARSPERSIDDMARDLMGRLEIARKCSSASLQADIDALAQRLYGVDCDRVIARAGLVRWRTRAGDNRRNCYLYTRTPQVGPRCFFAISSPPSEVRGWVG